MTNKTEQKYSAELKENAVRLANESSNVAESTCELGVKENTLYNLVYLHSRLPNLKNLCERMNIYTINAMFDFQI